MRTVAASLIAAALLLSACGDGGGGAGPPDGSRRIEKGGVRVDVPSSMRERPASAPGIVAAGPGDVPDRPRPGPWTSTRARLVRADLIRAAGGRSD
jgi:hypothetical protein